MSDVLREVARKEMARHDAIDKGECQCSYCRLLRPILTSTPKPVEPGAEDEHDPLFDHLLEELRSGKINDDEAARNEIDNYACAAYPNADTEANGWPLTEAWLERDAARAALDEWKDRFETESFYRREWAIKAERAEAALDAAKAEAEGLRKGIEGAIAYANNRETEWGDRAMKCFEILEDALLRAGKGEDRPHVATMFLDGMDKLFPPADEPERGKEDK